MTQCSQFFVSRQNLFPEFSSKKTNICRTLTICQTLMFGILNEEIFLSTSGSTVMFTLPYPFGTNLFSEPEEKMMAQIFDNQGNV